jgi:MFS family permease
MLLQPVKSFIKLLVSDRRFLAFEAVFFLYGLALMVLFPVIPMYIVDVAQMSYEQAGIATGILSQLAVIFLVTTWGRLMDHHGPIAICTAIFAILALVPLILLAGLHATGLPAAAVMAVYAGHIVHGIGMSGIHVAWSMGPVMFAGSRDSSSYSGAHVTLTGLRGVIGPIAGALVKMYFGYTPVFVISAVLFILGALGMAILHQRFKPSPSNSAELASS